MRRLQYYSLKNVLWICIFNILFPFARMENINNSFWQNSTNHDVNSTSSETLTTSGMTRLNTADLIVGKYGGCSGFNASGPNIGKVLYSADAFEISCKCFDQDSPITVFNKESCPEIVIQEGGAYLVKNKWESVHLERACTTVADLTVVSELVFVSAQAIIQCKVPGFPNKQGLFQVELRFRESLAVQPKDGKQLQERNVVFYTVLAFVVGFAVLLAFFLGFFCHNKGRLHQRRLENNARRRGLRETWRSSTLESSSTTCPLPTARGMAMLPQEVVTVSQVVPQDLPPSYHEAMLRHQESGELPPSYSNACSLMAAAVQARMGKISPRASVRSASTTSQTIQEEQVPEENVSCTSN